MLLEPRKDMLPDESETKSDVKEDVKAPVEAKEPDVK